MVNAIKKYKSELFSPGDFGRGLHRTPLRIVVRNVVLEQSDTFTTKYSFSALSSQHSVTSDTESDANALKKLQKERLLVARLGFPEKAFELDKRIEELRKRVKEWRQKEDEELLNQRMKLLHVSHNRKWAKLEQQLKEEEQEFERRIAEEEKNLLAKQERDFLHLLDTTTRRAIGRVKKCNCTKPYLCRHNKTASYNTRKPSKDVVTYRRNARRLRKGGRPEEAAIWEKKAADLDFKEQEEWRNRVSTSIIKAPWGANDAVVDQVNCIHMNPFC